MEPIVGKKDDHVRRGTEMFEQAASIPVFPELCNSGDDFKFQDDAFGVSETAPAGGPAPILGNHLRGGDLTLRVVSR